MTTSETVSETVAPNRFADTFGYPKGRAVTKLKGHMTPFVQEFIRHAPFCVLASSDRDGRCDASPKGGTPGFVRVLDEQHLLVPDVAGNRLFQSYQNMDSNPRVALLFFIPGVNETVRVNGRVTIVDKQELDRLNVALSLQYTDDNSKLLQGILIEVEEAYAHCPRALKFSNLWDVDTIASHQDKRPISDRPYDS
jgi:PPOX class probable FMN-dependent enzyme